MQCPHHTMALLRVTMAHTAGVVHSHPRETGRQPLDAGPSMHALPNPTCPKKHCPFPRKQMGDLQTRQ